MATGTDGTMLLLLIEVVTSSSALDGLTFGGGMPDASRRFKSGMEVAGSIRLSSGRERHAAMSSITASVMRLIVSRPISVP